MPSAMIEWVLRNLEAVAAILSASATIALVALYRRQGRILNAQKEIHHVERLPEIDLVDRTFDGDDLEVTVSNYGSGVAKNVRFYTAIAAPLADQIEPILLESRAHRVREGNQQTLERAIHPHESEVRFRGTPSVGFRLEGTERTYGDFSTGFNRIQQEDFEAVGFQIYVVVDDQLGGCQSKELLGFPRPAIRTRPEDTSDDAPSPPELPARPSLETLWNNSGLVYPNDPEFDVLEPDCRN